MAGASVVAPALAFLEHWLLWVVWLSFCVRLLGACSCGFTSTSVKILFSCSVSFWISSIIVLFSYRIGFIDRTESRSTNFSSIEEGPFIRLNNQELHHFTKDGVTLMLERAILRSFNFIY